MCQTEYRKLKVLVSAYACEPDKGSEPGVGWNWAKQIARFHEAWVITRANNKASIERELARNPDPNLHFIYVDLPRWLTFWKKGQRGIRTYYYIWQFAALKAALVLMKRVSFDLSHHVTFVNDWLFSFLALLPIPFIWGPIGSHPAVPRQFLYSRAWMTDRARLMIQNLMRSIDPLFYVTLLRSSKIIMIHRDLARQYPFFFLRREKFIFCPAIGIEETWNPKHNSKDVNDIVVIAVGRLIYLKGFDLAVHAFKHAIRSFGRMRFKIIGKGVERRHLEKIATDYGVDGRVEFSGELSHSEVLHELAGADIFLFPSFEGGGMVILEAMATGLPVVCLDFGGPGEMVTEECGIKVTPFFYEQAVHDLSDAIVRLASKAETRGSLGSAGKKRVQEVYGWSRKGALIQRTYVKCLKSE